jgi:hypothetical protein
MFYSVSVCPAKFEVFMVVLLRIQVVPSVRFLFSSDVQVHVMSKIIDEVAY